MRIFEARDSKSCHQFTVFSVEELIGLSEG